MGRYAGEEWLGAWGSFAGGAFGGSIEREDGGEETDRSTRCLKKLAGLWSDWIDLRTSELPPIHVTDVPSRFPQRPTSLNRSATESMPTSSTIRLHTATFAAPRRHGALELPLLLPQKGCRERVTLHPGK